MIKGSVNSLLEAVIRLTVRGPQGKRKRITAVIDTGYNGALTLPPDVIASLGLPWVQSGTVTLGDGSECNCDIYAGAVVWDRHPVYVLIEEADATPLVGMDLMRGFKLTMDIKVRGQVTIKSNWRGRHDSRGSRQ